MNKAQVTALSFLLLGVAWIGSGIFVGNGPDAPKTRAELTSGEEVESLLSVRVMRSLALPFQADITLQGRTMASRTIDLRAEVRGRVEKVLAEQGQALNNSDEIIRIAVDDKQARRDQAQAYMEQRRIQAEAARELAKSSFQSQVRLAEAEAQYEQAKADLLRFELDLANTIVRAPFDGILDRRSVDEGTVLNLGDHIGIFVDLDPIKATGQISERNVAAAEIGLPVRVMLSDGSALDGEVSYVAAVSDESTRTFTIEVTAPNPDGLVLAGLAAQMRLPFGERLAHRVPPSVLTLADDGRIGVKVLDSGDLVRFYAVEILDDGPRGTWLSGLPEQATIVIVGQDYLSVGQKVRPIAANTGSTS